MTVMKVLVGGHLIPNLLNAISYIRENDSIDAVAIGMTTREELLMNLRIFNDEVIDEQELPKQSTKQLLLVGIFCKKCKACIEVCPNHALSMGKEYVLVDQERCLLCGYCLPKCPELAIRLI